MDVGDFLQELGLQQHEAAFRDHGIDIRVLPKLTAEDLKDLGITMVGHRRVLLEAIAALRESTAAAAKAGPAAPQAEAMPSLQVASTTQAERRPLTVMFCDLVGSTALSSRLDPEDLRAVIRAYQYCVITTIKQFEGFIARYVGDGVLIYFGWPGARETDVERAVRAGLAVAAAVSESPMAGESLRVRVGIATGLVVVGEPIGSGDSRQQTAIGETPNRASRLHGLAGPGQVVIDAATRRQIGRLFECRDLGTFELKGLPAEVPAWQVLSENRTVGQFEALRSDTTPLVGRDEEIELLLRRWGQAKTGKGRVVLISGEPGVGKSRLAEALAERIAAETRTRLRYFCSPHHQDTAFYPVIAQIERAAGLEHLDEPAARLAKVQALFTTTAPPMEDLARIAELLSLPTNEFASMLTSQVKKEKAFEALLRRLEGLSRRKPLLMIFDDIHWIDASSIELLDRAIERIADLPVLLLAMFRPEFQPPWTGQPHVMMLTLAQLDRRDTAAMVANVAGSETLPSEILAEIVERTDGVPLFVEELTKAVLESGARTHAPLSASPHLALRVPPSLHASLMARLDRLGPAAKNIAQTGAAIGREFGYGLLTSVTGPPEPQIREALNRLANSGLLFVRGTPPEASYIFKHALVQDAAYGTLLRSHRQRLHSRIAAALEDQFPEIVLAQPALLAQHCAEAGLAEEALRYWLKAGRQALARFAMTEAVAQLRRGLDVLAALPDGAFRQHQELELLVALRPALATTKGFAAPEAGETLARARALAERLDRPEHLVKLLWGQWGFHCVRAEHRLALALGEQLEAVGTARTDAAAQMLGRLLQGASNLHLGELVTARALLEQSAGLGDPTHRLVGRVPVDPYAVVLTYLALALAYLGYIDQARLRMDEALSDARRLGHVMTLVHVLVWAIQLSRITRSPVVHLEEFLTLSAEHGLRHYSGWGLIYRQRSLVARGRAQESLVLLTQGLAELHGLGDVTGTPAVFTWLAEVHTQLGQHGEARNCLAEAARIVEATDERIGEAELLHRIPGDLLNAAGDQSGAEQQYRRAITVAERQSAKLFQLRASTSLARLWRDQGKRTEARDLLGPIYDWFTEGFDVPDLKDARALLGELS